jgi:hypothetical protein
MTPIDPGLEKTIYKMIKKQTGQKVETFSAFQASLKTNMGVFPDVPINILCAISEHDLWLINTDSVQQLPLKYLSPNFPITYRFTKPHSHEYFIPKSFDFIFLPTDKHISIRPIESSKQVNEFALWLTLMVDRDKLNWWQDE